MPILKKCKTCDRVYQNENDFTVGTSQWRKCESNNLWFSCSCGSTLMIPKGKFDWYRPEKNLSSAARSIFNQLSEIDQLPYIPTLVMKLQAMLRDENTDTNTLSRIVRQEPILASEIIALANNLKNARNPEVPEIKSVEHAITFVGRNELRDYALAISIKNFKLKTKDFDTKYFWDSAFLRGAIAEQLVKDLNLNIELDQAYLAATLCNIGKIVGAILFPDVIDNIHSAVNSQKSLCTWSSAEAKYPTANHKILGEIGAAIWGLPDYIMSAARFHHRENNSHLSKKNIGAIAELSGLANAITHWIMLEPTRISEKHLESLCKGFGLSTTKLEKMVERYQKLKFLKVDLSA